ncbi:hypothetical protein [Actinoplanes utahensis]|uniref:Uncharacterized protein n=1 Tax=Actinoplanes utahensis TaxID=1869 RepID=A0A0A6UII5_ACTUT|nr:hypothetical protein [Actinoplanes utahensis]KHD74134.1 hypothetical protein MB27_30570 [Actinoplanes utahensis]
MTAAFMVAGLAASVVIAAPAHAAPAAVLVTEAIPSTSVTEEDQLFFDKVFSFNTPDGKGVIAGTPDGRGEVAVDDQILIKVTRPDGTENTFVKNYEFQPPSAPIDISHMLAPGVNTVRIGLQDTFGVAYGSTSLWLIGGSDQGTGVSTVLSPDYKVVRWFMPLQDASDLTFSRCVKRLIKAGVTGVAPTCVFLLNTGNPEPAKAMTGGNWQKLIKKREHRGLLALPSYQVTCSAEGTVTATEKQGEPYINAGYTPTLGHKPALYLPADPYVNDPAYASGVPTVTTAADRRSVRVTLRAGARLNLAERGPGHLITGFDAPYIWTTLHARIGCDGRTSATLVYSDFPSTAAYQDGARALRKPQNADFTDFMTSGGRKPSGPGSDKLRSQCFIYAFPGADTMAIPAKPTKDDCKRGREHGFLPA